MTPLQKARLVLGETVEDMARELGIDKAHLSRLERQKAGCSVEVAERIVRVFRRRGIEMDERHVFYPRRYQSFMPRIKARRGGK